MKEKIEEFTCDMYEKERIQDGRTNNHDDTIIRKQ